MQYSAEAKFAINPQELLDGETSPWTFDYRKLLSPNLELKSREFKPKYLDQRNSSFELLSTAIYD